MKSIVINATDRFQPLGAMKTFYTGGDGTFRWNKLDGAYKFVVIDDLLVIGPIGDHVQLYAVHKVQDMSIEEAKTKVKIIIDEQWSSKRDKSVRAAGMISADGRVTGWKSTGFSVETPHEMREGIEQEVARLFRNGDLAIKE